ncbi:unnamed protein product [Linum trigynum]|uniref:Uncharacterized protein n=1 Tax=Linum trigynum TaxID=586398 RepID=A0AAV2GKT2_9ROSI
MKTCSKPSSGRGAIHFSFGDNPPSNVLQNSPSSLIQAFHDIAKNPVVTLQPYVPTDCMKKTITEPSIYAIRDIQRPLLDCEGETITNREVVEVAAPLNQIPHMMCEATANEKIMNRLFVFVAKRTSISKTQTTILHHIHCQNLAVRHGPDEEANLCGYNLSPHRSRREIGNAKVFDLH